jgi:hypothetical protein
VTDLRADSRYADPAVRQVPLAGWIAVPFVAELTLAAAVLALAGADDSGIHAALLATARLAFLLFLPAYIGSALATLFGPAFDGLRRRAREFGLAFAAALAVHLALVAWLCMLGDIPPVRTFVVFGVAAVCVYGLALFSIAKLQHWLGPRVWAVLRFLAMNYIACAFADDFLRIAPSVTLDYVLVYLPFALLAIAGPALYVAAFMKRWAPRLSFR